MKLVIEDEAGTRSIVPFAGDAIVVGRGTEGVTFRLPERNVSRRHARFVRQSGAVFVEDLGSLTGTRVNGERIAGRRRLREGDLVQIGDYDLALLAVDAALEPVTPPPLPVPAARDGRAPAPAAGRPTATEPTPTAVVAPPPAAPRPRAGRGRTLRRAAVVGVVALAIGLAAGWAVGTFGGSLAPPAPEAVTRP